MEFQGFQKIPRLSRECIITEKIDGTNAFIEVLPAPILVEGLFTEPTDFIVGSRKRFIKPGDDNFGFAAWAYKNQEQLKAELGFGKHFGEWWGAGINKRYPGAPRTFSLFNTSVWQTAKLEGKLTLCEVVPVLYQGLFTTTIVEEILAKLAVSKSMVWQDAVPEGVVVYHTAARTYFKKTLKDDEKGKEE